MMIMAVMRLLLLKTTHRRRQVASRQHVFGADVDIGDDARSRQHDFGTDVAISDDASESGDSLKVA